MNKGSPSFHDFNPVVFLVIRPTLKLVDAHNHPIRGGVAAAIVAWVVHYAIVFPMFWTDGLIKTMTTINPIVHIFFGIVALSNLGIGLTRYLGGQYGEQTEKS